MDKQGGKSPFNVFVNLFQQQHGDVSVVKKNAIIQRSVLALLYPYRVLKVDSCIDIDVLV